MMIRKLSHEEIQVSKLTPEEVKSKKRFPVMLILDNIRSLHNVGAMFRTADACLVEKIWLCGITGYPPRPEIAKTALGATEFVPWEYHSSTVDLIKNLKSEGVKIIGLELAEGSNHFKETEYEFPCALVLGHEVEGISDEVFALLDQVVEIPMHGMANSLNVATACGVLIYEVVEQYLKCYPPQANN